MGRKCPRPGLVFCASVSCAHHLGDVHYRGRRNAHRRIHSALPNAGTAGLAGSFVHPILLPPLALGILLSLAFGPYGAVGRWSQHFGIVMTNSAAAFVSTQVYVGMGYYVLGAVAAFDSVPTILQKQAALLGLSPGKVFLTVTLPLARLGLAVALSIAWTLTISEFGAVVVTAYYPSGMPVQLWINLQSFGLPAVMPLLVIFLAVALPLPWLLHVLAQRNRHA